MCLELTILLAYYFGGAIRPNMAQLRKLYYYYYVRYRYFRPRGGPKNTFPSLAFKSRARLSFFLYHHLELEHNLDYSTKRGGTHPSGIPE